MGETKVRVERNKRVAQLAPQPLALGNASVTNSKVSQSSQYTTTNRTSSKIILLAEGNNNRDIGRKLDITRKMARRWRNRWLELSELPVIERLQDEERSGAPATFSMEQVVELFASPVPNQAVTEDRSATGQKQSWRMRWSSRVSKAFPSSCGKTT